MKLWYVNKGEMYTPKTKELSKIDILTKARGSDIGIQDSYVALIKLLH